MRTIRITGEEYVKRLVAPIAYAPEGMNPLAFDDYCACKICGFHFHEDEGPIGRVNGKEVFVSIDGNYCPICGSRFDKDHDEVLDYTGEEWGKEVEITDSVLEIMVGSRMFREMFGESE